jgi:hypothetical protein
MVISESAAKKYFGLENPIGKTISLTTEWEGEITWLRVYLKTCLITVT